MFGSVLCFTCSYREGVGADACYGSIRGTVFIEPMQLAISDSMNDYIRILDMETMSTSRYAGVNCSVERCDARDGYRLAMPCRRPSALDFDIRSKQLYVGTYLGRLIVINTKTGYLQTKDLTPWSIGVNLWKLVYNPATRSLLTGTEKGLIRVFKSGVDWSFQVIAGNNDSRALMSYDFIHPVRAIALLDDNLIVTADMFNKR